MPENLNIIFENFNHIPTASRDCLVGITTRYGLDSPGIESRWGEIFQIGSRAHPASYTIGTGSLSRA